VLLVPLIDRVCGLFILESLEDGLVLNGDLDQLLLSPVAVETADFEALRVVKFGFGILHDV